MAELAENLRTYVLADATIAADVGTRMTLNEIPAGDVLPYLWYQQSGTQDVGCLEGPLSPDPDEVDFDVEVVAADQAAAVALAKKVRNRLRDKSNLMFGDQRILGSFVENHDENYLALNDFSDDGRHVETFRLRLFPA